MDAPFKKCDICGTVVIETINICPKCGKWQFTHIKGSVDPEDIAQGRVISVDPNRRVETAAERGTTENTARTVISIGYLSGCILVIVAIIIFFNVKTSDGYPSPIGYVIIGIAIALCVIGYFAQHVEDYERKQRRWKKFAERGY
jgi:hypothetical protein